ncbi:lytic transglycosylase domain-containing protein [Glaciimonas sp. PAMC28666]|uniref:lytic transglycosylase domain-containing protein n=1 Tax=Glaciimonas sp. PAMC28666 TaxID=2807626 RepID=UPI001F04AD97|nr:lytic transglycosylase domain-containing protein [Glaciimonas sp. PAMC28666]
MLARSIKVGTTRVRVGPQQTPLDVVKQLGSQSANLTTNALSTVRSTVSNVLDTTGVAGMAVLVVGLISVIGITALVAKPELAADFKGLSSFMPSSVPVSSSAPSALPALAMTDTVTTSERVAMETRTANNLAAIAETIAQSPSNQAAVQAKNQAHTVNVKSPVVKASDVHQQQWVTSWLSKRYRVAGDATNMFVSTAYKTAKETKLDPLLILAVMAIESGLNPFAESPVGAQGLMQVMSKVHQEKFENFGGVKAALNPAANIKVGSLILKDYVNQGGSVEAGLKRYVGAAAFDNDGGYGNRVLAEYRRLQDVATGKNVSSRGGVVPNFAPKRPVHVVTQAPVTTPGDISAMPAEAAADVKDFKQHQSQSASDQNAII